MNSALELKDISFTYASSEIMLFKEFSLEVKVGEFFGIIGPNGSGKTTLLKLMQGFLKPQKGSIFIFSQAIDKFNRRELAKIIGYVPQENFFAFEYTVFDVVLWGRNPYLGRLENPKKDDLTKVMEALTITDTIALKDKSINQISAGERQRVVLARALAQQPKILLLDEATTHLDITHQVEFARILKKLNNLGLTIIFLSHDLNLAGLICSRMLLLDNGKPVACDRPEIILRSELIEKVYRVKPYLQNHPASGLPQIILPL